MVYRLVKVAGRPGGRSQTELWRERQRRRREFNLIYREQEINRGLPWSFQGAAAATGPKTFATSTDINSSLVYNLTSAKLNFLKPGNWYEFEGYFRLLSMIIGDEPYSFRATYFDTGGAGIIADIKQLTVAQGMVPFRIQFKVRVPSGNLRLRSNDAAKSANIEVNRLAIRQIFPTG